MALKGSPKALLLLFVLGLPAVPSEAAAPSASEIIKRAGTSAGLFVLLGDKDAALALKLAKTPTELILYLQFPEDKSVEAGAI